MAQRNTVGDTMKILLVVNKTYRGQIDGGWWYLYLPLKDLGHEVYFYDTVDPEEKDFTKVVESFKPDLVFCCMTGDTSIAPHEPWEKIKKETDSGRTTTFNWFCDDTWRFEDFSKTACKYFNVCSTPEPSYVNKYKMAGYSNILVGAWHANLGLYQEAHKEQKNIDISFMGAMNGLRKHFIETHNDLPIETFSNLSHEEMLSVHARSKIGINLSINENDPAKKTQMKQRMFEIPAANTLLLSEYHEDLEHFFDVNKEIITFKSNEEFSEKAKFLLSRPLIAGRITAAGHKRFLSEHESKVRLTKVLEQIQELK